MNYYVLEMESKWLTLLGNDTIKSRAEPQSHEEKREPITVSSSTKKI